MGRASHGILGTPIVFYMSLPSSCSARLGLFRWAPRLFGCVLFCVAWLCVLPRAFAESERAQNDSPLLVAGLRALEARKYAVAQRNFEDLYRSTQTPVALYLLGRVALGENKSILAADLFRRYRELLDEPIDPNHKSVIDSHLASVSEGFVEARVVAPDDSFLYVDGRLIGRSPLIGPVLLSPGLHRFAMEQHGKSFESGALTLLEGRAAQVNLSAGTGRTAIAVLSSPPAALLVIVRASAPVLSGDQIDSLNRVAGAALAKEQTYLIPVQKLRQVVQDEPADCFEKTECLYKVAERASARSVVVVRPKEAQTASNSFALTDLLGTSVLVHDETSRLVAAQTTFECPNCTHAQLLEGFGKTVGDLMAQVHKRPRAMLSVTSSPSSSMVRVDGQTVGQTPVERLTFTGTHTVSVSADGYVAEEKNVELFADTPQTLEFALKRKAAVVPANPVVVEQTTSARPIWRLAVGSVLASGGLLLAVFGVSALSMNQNCGETQPSVPNAPCPQVYFTSGVGGGPLGGGLVLTAAGVAMVAWPERSKTTPSPISLQATSQNSALFTLSF